MEEIKKKIMLSGIQPSGDLHLGNYLGAVRNWGARAEEFDCYYFMADLHTLTVRQDPKLLRRRSLEQLAQYIACGIDPEKNVLFLQSHVHEHAELGWILNCYTMFGELSRMTQFKDKCAKNADNINGGLFTYPKAGARVMGLANPSAKMSKSDPNGCVFLMEKPEDIARKFKRAVTDSDTENCVHFDMQNKPGVSNLMNIYSAVTGESFEEIEREFAGKGYGAFKPAVGDAVIETLRPIREEATRLLEDKQYLCSVYTEGAQRASVIARKTLRKVYKKIGLVEKPF